jgi:hypothetical protein
MLFRLKCLQNRWTLRGKRNGNRRTLSDRQKIPEAVIGSGSFHIQYTVRLHTPAFALHGLSAFYFLPQWKDGIFIMLCYSQQKDGTFLILSYTQRRDCTFILLSYPQREDCTFIILSYPQRKDHIFLFFLTFSLQNP